MSDGGSESGIDSAIVPATPDTPHVGGTPSPEVASEVGQILAGRQPYVPDPTYEDVKKLAQKIIAAGVEKGAARSAIQVYAPKLADLKPSQYPKLIEDFHGLEKAVRDRKADELEREMTWVERTIRDDMTSEQARNALLIEIAEFIIGKYQGDPSSKIENIIKAKETFALTLAFGK